MLQDTAERLARGTDLKQLRVLQPQPGAATANASSNGSGSGAASPQVQLEEIRLRVPDFEFFRGRG